MNLENFKDPSLIPNSIKFIALFFALSATIALGFVFDTNDQIAQLDTLSKNEIELRTKWVDKKSQAVNLDSHKKQLAEIEVAFGTLLRQLPNKSEMDALLNDINQAGVGRGLNFELFKPAQNELVTEFYAEQPVSIIVSGGFHDIGSFAEDVSKLPRIVNLGDMNIRNATDPIATFKGVPSKLVLEATVRTYRYLDEKEKLAAKNKTNKKP
jgi:type IV pilus assembly protein PilO